jgi:hypothetical protein
MDKRKRIIDAAATALGDEFPPLMLLMQLYDLGFLCMPPKDKAEMRQPLIDIIVSVGNQSEGVLADAIIAAGWQPNK